MSKEKSYSMCQSCSMPMNKDPEGGGTNSDGTKSKMYCSYCYENGAFRQPDWTVEQMEEFVKGKLKEMGIPGFMTGFMAGGIHHLERWKK